MTIILSRETRQLVQTCRKHKGDADKLVDALQNFQQNFRSILVREGLFLFSYSLSEVFLFCAGFGPSTGAHLATRGE